MLLQNDKSILTLGKDRASRILFDDEPMVATKFSAEQTGHLFNNNHNLNKYDKLVQNDYSGSISGAVNTAVAKPHFEKYYTQANPVPYHSFRPKVLTDFPDYVESKTNPAAFPDEAFMEKVAESEVIETAASVNTEKESNYAESYLKLNAKGVIACVAFIAITALIVVLVIINSIAIGNTGARLESLKAENTQLTADYNSAMAARESAFNTGVANAGSIEGVPPATVELPPIRNYQLNPSSSDNSTNLFDQICKFLSSLFG